MILRSRGKQQRREDVQDIRSVTERLLSWIKRPDANRSVENGRLKQSAQEIFMVARSLDKALK
ncbi:MAG: hypothetical protein STSR0007_02790 [Thermovirga sp.]